MSDKRKRRSEQSPDRRTTSTTADWAQVPQAGPSQPVLL